MSLMSHSLAANITRPAWQIALQQAFSKPAELLAYLKLEDSALAASPAAVQQFALRVPLSFAARMQPGNAQDPLLLQVWPQAAEEAVVEGFSKDAVGDLAKHQGNGLIHKYQGRALVVLTGACAVHCRYCFRRHFPYADGQTKRSHWQALLDALSQDPSIEEVILSGGDPLSLTDEKLTDFIAQLASLPSVQRLRIHSRTAVVLPERITAELLHSVQHSRLQTVMVLHVNHAQEINAEVATALAALRQAGVLLLNQAVLLKGVNDSVAAQRALSERLFSVGVLPYYLHLLDRVQGAAHFEVPEDHAKQLCRRLAEQLPGYLVPRLARETAGAPYKNWIAFQ